MYLDLDLNNSAQSTVVALLKNLITNVIVFLSLSRHLLKNPIVLIVHSDDVDNMINILWSHAWMKDFFSYDAGIPLGSVLKGKTDAAAQWLMR